MFSLQHFIWLAICVLCITVATVFLRKHKVPLNKLMTAACVAAVIAELIKTFSVIQLVPTADGTSSFVFIEPLNLPFHLCSIQIIFIFYCRFAKEGKVKDILYAFMYPTCTIGAFIALALPSIFDEVPVSRIFTSLHPYEYFLYHSFLVILGLHIYYSYRETLRPKHYFTTVGFLGVLAYLSLYLNSIFATPIYENGVLVGVENTTNFFFTYKFVIDLKFTALWQWYLYLGAIFAAACIFIALFYIPVFIRYFKQKKESVNR